MKKTLISAVIVTLMYSYSASVQAQWNYNSTSPSTTPIYTNNGSVGIGTQTPQGSLEVKKPDASVYVTASNTNNLMGTPSIYINRVNEGLKLEYIPNVLARISNTFMGESGNIALSTWGKDRMTILGTGNIGIGTNAPRTNFELRTNDATMYITADNATAGGVGNPSLYINRISEGLKLEYVPNVLARISNTYTGDNVGHIALNTKGQDRLIITGSGNVGIGTTIAAIAANAPNYKLAVAGTIGAKEVVVEVVSGMWPDYVFEKDYPLAPLDSVAAFVKANKHLPEVPSATEVENNGVQLGEMNMLLLKKIEELTLYVIDQNKKIADQQMQIQAQQVQIGALINEIKK